MSIYAQGLQKLASVSLPYLIVVWYDPETITEVFRESISSISNTQLKWMEIPPIYNTQRLRASARFLSFRYFEEWDARYIITCDLDEYDHMFIYFLIGKVIARSQFSPTHISSSIAIICGNNTGDVSYASYRNTFLRPWHALAGAMVFSDSRSTRRLVEALPNLLLDEKMYTEFQPTQSPRMKRSIYYGFDEFLVRSWLDNIDIDVYRSIDFQHSNSVYPEMRYYHTRSMARRLLAVQKECEEAARDT